MPTYEMIPAVGGSTSTDVVLSHCTQVGFSLEDYWKYMKVNENIAYGIVGSPSEAYGDALSDGYWDQRDREFLAEALNEALDTLESDAWLGFPLRRRYFGALRLPYGFPFYLGKYLRGCGVPAESDISLDHAIALRNGLGVINDPVVITVVTDVISTHEIILYYPGSRDCYIEPSRVTISGGTATILVPRCRLLKPEYFIDYGEHIEDRPVYTDDDFFLDSVDIVRNYLDTTTGVNLVWDAQNPNNCNSILCNGSLTTQRLLATTEVRDQRNGVAIITTPTTSYPVSRKPDGIEVNYMRGRYDRYEPMYVDIARALISIAHNNMPEGPCVRRIEGIRYYKQDIKPLEPAVGLRLGPSTWGIYKAVQVIKHWDSNLQSHFGGLL